MRSKPDIKTGVFLRDYTSLHLGGKVAASITVKNNFDLELLPETLKNLGLSPLILGNGSNILAKDEDLDLALIHFDFGKKFEVREEKNNVFIRTGADYPLSSLLSKTAKAGYSGLEGLAGVPGSVGGAVAMNAGSFGTEISETVAELQVFHPFFGFKTLKSGEFKGNYREFTIPIFEESKSTLAVNSSGLIFGITKSWYIITEVVFSLKKSNSDEVQQKIQNNFLKKKNTQPLNKWSAGCIFKNPVPTAPAGKLLDEVGFKGRRLGDMEFSEIHANFLINRGKGSSQDAFNLIAEAKQEVLLRFGYDLQLEVQVY